MRYIETYSIVKSTEGKLYLSNIQKSKIDITLNCCRYVYNEMLSRSDKMYSRRGERLSYYDMVKTVNSMKLYKPWLRDADSQALSQACKRLDNAYRKFFKGKSGHPKFHKKTGRQTYITTNPASIHIKSNKVRIPVIGWVRVRGLKTLNPEDKICRATIIKNGGEYNVIIVYRPFMSLPISHLGVNPNNVIGLDYSSPHLYVDSNGNKPDFEHMFSKSQAKLAKAQRVLSRRKGSHRGEDKSSNWYKQYNKVCKLHSKVANQRKDALHKLSKKLADQYDVIVVEGINMRSLSNKEFGNGKATMDNGYGMFRIMLDYKLHERGKSHLLKTDMFYPSSQLCNVCGYRNRNMKNLSIRNWYCPECGSYHDRDLNAAINIRNYGLEKLNLVPLG